MLLLCIAAFNAWSKLPQGCFEQGFKFEDDLIHFVDKSTAYLIKNKNAYPIFIDQAEHEGAQAGWLVEIAPEQMNVLHLSEPMAMQCFEKRPGSEMKIDCRFVLEPCKMQSVKIDPKDKSNYWLTENKAYPQIVDKLKRQGLYQTSH